jgi:ketosteroid isomerase-like protein
MRYQLTCIILGLLACICGYPVLSQDTLADAKTLVFLKKFRGEYTRALVDDKPDAAAAYYGADVRLMPEYQKLVVTKANALLYLKAYVARFDVKDFVREEIEVMDLGKRVIEFGTFTQQLVLRSKGETHTLKGKYADIWERTAAGELVLITEAWNYSHQVDIGVQLIFPDVPAITAAFLPRVPVNTSIAFELAAYNHFLESVVGEHNPKLWGMYYTDDFLLFYSGTPVVKGRKAIDAHIEEHVKHLPVFEKLDIRTDRIDDLGRYLIEYGTHIAIVRDGDWSGVATGKDLRIWRREPGGQLKICRGVAMYD